MKADYVCWNEYNTKQDLAENLATKIAHILHQKIQSSGKASLAVSGGTTPNLLFEQLSQQPIEWSKIFITLVDERFVPDTSPRSNAKLVQEKLRQHHASKAIFFPLFSEKNSVEEAAINAHNLLKNHSHFLAPLDVTILGMGTDGHTASFFPDAQNLPELLDPKLEQLVCAVHAPSALEDRLTLSFPLIISSHFLALHIEGTEKKSLLTDSLLFPSHLPIRHVIDGSYRTVQIFWAP